jgi:hypothetical protein
MNVPPDDYGDMVAQAAPDDANVEDAVDAGEMDP